MSDKKLILEILTGPLDGHIVALEEETTWGMQGEGALVFPWDEELGDRQARFFLEGGKWRLEGYDAPHGTYCVNRKEREGEKIELEEGDILKASDTWLLVRQVE